ncbi:hypothetical protein HD806DRAFT_552786 [Xylariaceae sp. AK1471]|nr:hypothetical protein HD806DRAFT_552786 [Xylariaceae sp. AK1471]
MEVYERCSPLKLLMEDSRVKLPTVAVYSALSVPLRGLFILMTMAQQMHKLPRDTEKQVFARARSAIAYWTYQVVHALNEDITEEKTRASDGTMTGVLMLLYADQQLQPSPRWRFHYGGLMKMAQLRGGIEKLLRESPHMWVGTLTMLVIEVFANTTSPSHDQLAELTHPKNLDFCQSKWGDRISPIYIGSICPPSLLFDIIRVNHLRALATGGLASPFCSSSFDDDMPVYTDAQTLLDRTLNFSPETFAEKNGNERTRASWLLMGRIHQSAVVLYCILSLQHVLLLPQSSDLERTANTHYDRLLLDLKEGFRYTNFKNCLFWPLVVAGVRAARGTAFERTFVAEQFRDAVKDTGSSIPIFACRTLMAFWESGKTGWDECFDQPYLFVM